MNEPALPEIVLAVDYGQRWPLSDIMWPEKRPNWGELLSGELITRLETWAAFFLEHGDHETGSLGGEANRKWFDLEGVRLLNDLSIALDGKYRVRLNLWF